MTTLIIGAGIAGLAAAMRLAHAGEPVRVIEAQSTAGGKIRTLSTAAGPVDAGPTVLTMRPIFEALFRDVGEDLSDHLDLIPQDRLARHFWTDGTTLDLFSDSDRNSEAIANTFGARAARDYRAFHDRTLRLFEAFEGPMIRAAAPSRVRTTWRALTRPGLLAAMAPHHSMAQTLAGMFSEPRLAQLFGRYATYVGGAPTGAPALLSLIWQAEAGGVWQAVGGMQALAKALQTVAKTKGAEFQFDTPVSRLIVKDNAVRGVICEDHTIHRADRVMFNGDPAALATGRLGDAARSAVRKTATSPRSHSAHVWSFAARPSRDDLCLHNVFFADDPLSEFADLKAGRLPKDPTLYVYAQDRGSSAPPPRPERFEIIANAPPLTAANETSPCPDRTLTSLRTMGLAFSPNPEATLSTPKTFDTLFPASGGALYGRSPHGLMAAFQRPTARTPIAGLYLAGGGCHPGAGVPMATLSGCHAAEAILIDRISISPSRRTAMPGGMSTGSPTTAARPSPSSAS